jgi:SAM-dependent methyltransferase
MEAAEQFLEAQKTIWSSGDWPGFAPIIQDVADLVVEEIGTGEGHDFLDVATGSGNAAMAAAARGARVTGLDLVPKLVEAARARAAAEGVEADFVEGNAEADLGPIVVAKSLLEPQGKWEAARADLMELERSHNEADDGSLRAQAEYLLTKVLVAG